MATHCQPPPPLMKPAPLPEAPTLRAIAKHFISNCSHLWGVLLMFALFGASALFGAYVLHGGLPPTLNPSHAGHSIVKAIRQAERRWAGNAALSAEDVQRHLDSLGHSSLLNAGWPDDWGSGRIAEVRPGRLPDEYGFLVAGFPSAQACSATLARVRKAGLSLADAPSCSASAPHELLVPVYRSSHPLATPRG